MWFTEVISSHQRETETFVNKSVSKSVSVSKRYESMSTNAYTQNKDQRSGAKLTCNIRADQVFCLETRATTAAAI
jgi:hypothetical protein